MHWMKYLRLSDCELMGLALAGPIAMQSRMIWKDKAMDISSKRFNIQSDGFGNVNVRDRDAPFHVHTVKVSDVPTVHQMAMMKERDFDRAVSKAIYSE